MNSIVYIGMDVHKQSFTLCCYRIGEEKVTHIQKTGADYRFILKYIDCLRLYYPEETDFICGYEAGSLGYSLYHQLTEHNIKCTILAPTTMPTVSGKKRIKTDKRDAENIAKCLAYHTYSPVHVPTPEDEQVKEYIRMRDDHKLALKKVKQQILSFCLRHDLRFDGTRNSWTQAHLKWLHSLKLEGIYQEILAEYLLTYDNLIEKLKRLDKRIEELASTERYREAVHKLVCFLGIRTHTALCSMVEISDFNRFCTAEKFAAYLGLVPGENSSGEATDRLSITKAGNTHMRQLLTEAAQSYGRGQAGHKSRELRNRQEGNSPEVIAYADRANERLRRRYYRMILNGKKQNVVKTAIARELACFIWGMMTGRIA